ncbi:MAG: hypothetical protein LBM02_06455 [Lachnospiraceae bacterium]|jgi:hypothetical protein|nr:hypothetical protein [Lachnospiraceae bacterium]
MDDNRNAVFEFVFNSSDLKELDIADELKQYGRLFGANNKLYHDVYKTIFNHKDSFKYDSFVGSDIEMKISYENEIIFLKRGEQVIKVGYEDFLTLLSFVDISFSKVLPLYTVVELEEEMFNEDLQKVFASRKNTYVALTARKILVTDGENEYVIDYYGRLWPYGEIPDIPPILVTNMLIKKVVSMGISDDDEIEFATYDLWKKQVESKLISTAFMSEEQVKKLFAFVDTEM